MCLTLRNEHLRPLASSIPIQTPQHPIKDHTQRIPETMQHASRNFKGANQPAIYLPNNEEFHFQQGLPCVYLPGHGFQLAQASSSYLTRSCAVIKYLPNKGPPTSTNFLGCYKATTYYSISYLTNHYETNSAHIKSK